jgi:predicted  nucleic acid-binding Zn-ribbon protein
MQDEVEMLGRLRSKLEEKVLSFMDQLEGIRSGEAAAKQTMAQAAVALKSKQAEYKQEAETLIAQARLLAAQRIEAAKQVDPTLMQRYDKLRALKNGLAIVAMEDKNACGGCTMGLPSSIVKRVISGEAIEICENCKRILVDIV